jgi:hypothetical protein
MEFQESKVYLGTQVCPVHLDSKDREAWKENLEDLADRVCLEMLDRWESEVFQAHQDPRD